MKNILVLAEIEGNELRPEFWELATVAKSLSASTSCGIDVAVIGAKVDAALEQIAKIDARTVHVLEDDRLADPWPEAHAAALVQLCRELTPQIAILPRTVLGAEMAVRLAVHNRWQLLQDVTQVEVTSEGSLKAVRPVSGGAVMATVHAGAGPCVVVPRPRAFAPSAAASGDACTVVRHTFEPPPLRTTCGEVKRVAIEGMSVDRARVVISGGGGLGGPEPFALLRQIADLIGGAVGASRVAVDSGWVPPALQVGLTGKTIAPDVYVAVGISGAIQHLVGCSSSPLIVAVNSEKSAPIFGISNYGVVGDWKEVMPAFLERLLMEQRVS
ncbi:MAG: electron transfer flavoprotein subunit alpha/FixB family protein [Ideonella sp.]|nr:electron transfer flavoprotein subunit alpha/FixB family protein [Ideonella sp.]